MRRIITLALAVVAVVGIGFAVVLATKYNAPIKPVVTQSGVAKKLPTKTPATPKASTKPPVIATATPGSASTTLPSTTAATTPPKLSNSGPGNVAAVFVASSVAASCTAYAWILKRNNQAV